MPFPVGKPCKLPANTPWYLYLAQTLDGGKSFSVQKLRDDAVHTGDICTLGIFCLPADNRDLADTNDIKIDATGGFQVAYTYETTDGTRKEIDFQCQTGGPGLYANTGVTSCQAVAAANKGHKHYGAAGWVTGNTGSTLTLRDGRARAHTFDTNSNTKFFGFTIRYIIGKGVPGAPK